MCVFIMHPLLTSYCTYIISPHRHNNNPAKWNHPQDIEERKLEAHTEMELV